MTFMDSRRDKAIFNCGMYGGIAFGWAVDPLTRWAAGLVGLTGDPPIPFPVFQTFAGMVLCVSAGVIILRRDQKQADYEAGRTDEPV